MNDYQPKVGDRVMVGEHGPYWLGSVHAGYWEVCEGPTSMPAYVCTVPTMLLTPAPEPEPDEPTAPGALVRTGTGSYAVRSDEVGPAWTVAGGAYQWGWERLIRPITVVLADPAEVEKLRAERDEAASELAHLSSLNNALIDAKNDLVSQRDKLFAERDELQRRIDKVVEYCDDPGNWGTYEKRRWLIAGWLGKGES